MNLKATVNVQHSVMGYCKFALALLSASLLLVSSVVVSAQNLREQMKTTLSDFAGQPDVTCFYCQKLHREVDQLNAKGVEVRYLAFPRSGIESEGAEKLATAWCADDQQTALTELKAGVELPVNRCEGNPIAAQYELGKEMGVSGTPAIVTSSGELIPGYRPAAALVALLGLD
jgi:thiol:disulfide interchange protein DsbC